MSSDCTVEERFGSTEYASLFCLKYARLKRVPPPVILTHTAAGNQEGRLGELNYKNLEREPSKGGKLSQKTVRCKSHKKENYVGL